MSRAHGTQREMAAMAVLCAQDTPRQATEFVNVIYVYFTHPDILDVSKIRLGRPEKHLCTLSTKSFIGSKHPKIN